LHVVKNRGGDRGVIPFYFFPAFARFDEIAVAARADYQR
jgi:hypothetical protein